MKTRVERIYIDLTVPKQVVYDYEGVFFQDKGIELEDSVPERNGGNVVHASFDGFEVLNDAEQAFHLGQEPDEPSITAKLYYYVDIQVG